MSTTIKDPLLNPFYIGRDNYGYTVYEVIKPKENINGEKGKGIDYEKPISHHSNFGQALKRVMKAKLHVDGKSYSSIKGYLLEFEKQQELLKQLTNLGI
tara:strand:- start:17 stop:313 length:297 start_codon:yes stop_codon:yes gene_type:complete